MAGFLMGACLVFFILFAVYFYIVQQGDVIALTHYIKSGGDASQHRFVPALIAVVLGLIPALLLYKLMHFPLRLKALALLPSYILLGVMSSTAPLSYESNELQTPMLWACIMMFVSVVAILLVAMMHEDRAEHKPLQCYLPGNVLLTCVGVLLTMCLSANDRMLHEQLAVEHLASDGRWDDVLEVANDPTCQNRNITAMHVLALSKKGQLADELFTVPGLKSSESLMPDTFASARLYGAGRMVCQWLDATPARGSHMSVARFLKRAVEKDSVPDRVLVDYYLCSLLLDKKLAAFVSELPRYYNVNDSLPRHYREAYIMYQRRARTMERPLVDEATTTSYQDFLKIMTDNKNDVDKQRQACLDMYGGTYWTYLLVHSS